LWVTGLAVFAQASLFQQNPTTQKRDASNNKGAVDL